MKICQIRTSNFVRFGDTILKRFMVYLLVERITNCIEKCATVKAYEKIIETNLTLKSDSLKDFIDENSNKEATDAEQKR